MEKEEFLQELVKIQDFSGSEDEIEALTSLVVEFANSIGFELPKEQLFLGTNSKTGKYVVNLSFTSALHCPESIKGHCNVQKPLRDSYGLKTSEKQVCYACAINNRHIETTIKCIWNYIQFYKLTVNEIKEQIKRHILVNNCQYLRFNEYGSFIDEKCLQKCITISNALVEDGLIKNSFSYTSNRYLFKRYKKVPNFVLSLSQGLDVDFESLDSSIKQTAIITLSSVSQMKHNRDKAVENGRKTLLPLLDNPNVVICCGDCSKCPYCKNNEDKRVVVFLRHGNGWDGHIDHYLTDNEYMEYLKQLHIDNNKF